MLRLAIFLLVAGSCALPCRALAQLGLHEVADVSAPMYVTHAGDERLFIVERTGRILIHTPAGGVDPVPFLDIAPLVDPNGEGGLLSIAFHPDHASNGAFYVHYTRTSAPLHSVVARYLVSADPDVADPNSAVILIDELQPFPNHNGGQLQFGPNDGYLYVGLGDGGGSGDPGCRAQRNDERLGNILRIDADPNLPTYAIPPDNPFGGAGEPPAEVWALGLRNPWRFSFDRATGDLWIGDVGQSSWEEIDMQPAASPGGENYGWKVMEGLSCFDPDPDCPVSTPSCFDASYTDPVHVYARQGFPNDCSVTGGFVYRGSAIPELVGDYVFGDYCTGNVRALSYDGAAWQSRDLLSAGFGLTSFGEDASGELYLMVGDKVLRLTSQFQTKAQRQCSQTLLRGHQRVSKASAKDLRVCVRDGAAGKLAGTIEACAGADRKGKVARAQQKLADQAARRCAVPPLVGPEDAAAVNATAAQTPGDLLHDAFGPDLDAATASKAAEPARWKCQTDVVRGLERCLAGRLKEFGRCAKDDLGDDQPDTDALLALCMERDPKGRVAKLCDAAVGKLGAKVIPKSCVAKGADLSDSFPGCASDDPATVAACLERSSACRVCLALDQAGDLDADCDAIDDGVSNTSCQ
jgi:glucose/arabinose dehydrogenase